MLLLGGRDAALGAGAAGRWPAGAPGAGLRGPRRPRRARRRELRLPGGGDAVAELMESGEEAWQVWKSLDVVGNLGRQARKGLEKKLKSC